jgi:hypothetical protein
MIILTADYESGCWLSEPGFSGLRDCRDYESGLKDKRGFRNQGISFNPSSSLNPDSDNDLIRRQPY